MFSKSLENIDNLFIFLHNEFHCSFHIVNVDNQGISKGSALGCEYRLTSISIESVGPKSVHSLSREGAQFAFNYELSSRLYVLFVSWQHSSFRGLILFFHVV